MKDPKMYDTFTPAITPEGVVNDFQNAKMIFEDNGPTVETHNGERILISASVANTLMEHVMAGVITRRFHLQYGFHSGCWVGWGEPQIARTGIRCAFSGMVLMVKREDLVGRDIFTGKPEGSSPWVCYGGYAGDPAFFPQGEFFLKIDTLPDWAILDTILYHRGEWSIADVRPLGFDQPTDVLIRTRIFHSPDGVWVVNGMGYRWKGEFVPHDASENNAVLVGMEITITTPDGSSTVTIS